MFAGADLGGGFVGLEPPRNIQIKLRCLQFGYSKQSFVLVLCRIVP